MSGLVNWMEQRAGVVAPHIKPRLDGIARAVRRVTDPRLASFATAHRERAALALIVAELERHEFRPTQTSAVREREHRRVSRTCSTVIDGARCEQYAQFASAERSSP